MFKMHCIRFIVLAANVESMVPDLVVTGFIPKAYLLIYTTKAL